MKFWSVGSDGLFDSWIFVDTRMDLWYYWDMKHLLPFRSWILETTPDGSVVVGMFADEFGSVLWDAIDSSNIPYDLLRLENGKLSRIR